VFILKKFKRDVVLDARYGCIMPELWLELSEELWA
jgi:hypothetical protein